MGATECNSHNMYPNLSATLSNDQQFRLNKINEVKDYFIAEIKERELMSKRLSKYIASFDYFDKSLIPLWKESIRMMHSQRNDVEKVSLIEEGKKIGINEVIRRNEIINNRLK